MKFKVFLFISLMCGCITFAHSSTKSNRLDLLPMPKDVKISDGNYEFGNKINVSVSSKELIAYGDILSELLKGYDIQAVVKKGKYGDVVLKYDKSLSGESYTLDVRKNGVEIKAAGKNGFIYGIVTLNQLVQNSLAQNSSTLLPIVSIYDEPRFEYRGFMLDVSRFFMPKESLLTMIDCMAMLKLNRLHLHLTDDNGWRLEIKKYPKLTETGAWRVFRDKPFPARENAKRGEPTPVGGFYTQEDMKEIIAHAAKYGIEIIPEIDVPAHSNAALASYPQFACPVVKDFIGVIPGLGGRNAEVIFCAGNDSTFTFLNDVLDEVMALFPSKYIHIGGDEASKTNWRKCPLCQKRLKDEHIENEEELQGYFMERIASHIRSKGREVMGWDELTNSKLPENAIIFGWQGMGNAALKAAKQGHKFIMTPARALYLIRYQGPQWFEPLTYFGNNTLKDVFDYEPVRSDWAPEFENLLMGIQGSMWTEFCSKPEDVFYLVFPRLAAVAHTSWVTKGNKDWQAFLAGLDAHKVSWDRMGINYSHKSMFNIQHKVRPGNEGLRVELECIRPDVEIRYTMDGTNPDSKSKVYEGPLTIVKSVTIKALTFSKGKPMGDVLTLPVDFNLATAGKIEGGKGEMSLLLNGVRGSEKMSDFEWVDFYNVDSTSFTVSLAVPVNVSTVTLGTLINSSMAGYLPKKVKINLLNSDGEVLASTVSDFDEKESFVEGNFIKDLNFELKAEGVAGIEVEVKGAGTIPEGQVRAGQHSRFLFDEIIVK